MQGDVRRSTPHAVVLVPPVLESVDLAYELARAGQILVIRLGRRRMLVPRAQLEAMVRDIAAGSSPPSSDDVHGSD